MNSASLGKLRAKNHLKSTKRLKQRGLFRQWLIRLFVRSFQAQQTLVA
ncbi:hypothetical protein DJ56_3359 [Yersinia pestis]|nr:hypothetical protein DJ56_3359 [Yersinia pestis]